MVSWRFLLIGSLGAVGAALAVGTIAAFLRYHRTGAFPGQDSTTEVSTGRIVGLWLRVLVGLAVAVYAVATLADAGLL